MYADGEWQVPLAEHIEALRSSGLLEQLDSLQVGIVGSFANTEQVIMALMEQKVRWTLCAQAREGWEQVTLDELWAFAQDNDGLVLYCHTKGAANFDPINNSWRRSMTYYNVIDWATPVAALRAGKSIAGCHWIRGSRATNPDNGDQGFFGGNYWWTHLEILRHNKPPDSALRHYAEHWLGHLSDFTPITNATMLDLNPTAIWEQNLRTQW